VIAFSGENRDVLESAESADCEFGEMLTQKKIDIVGAARTSG